MVLTLAFLRHGLAGTWDGFTYSTGMELRSGEETRETDFFAWCRRVNIGYFPEPETVIGECKSFGSETFQSQDIDRMKQLADWIPGAFLVAATLKGSFSSKELKELRGLARWGWQRERGTGIQSPLILLTERELLSNESLPSAWEEAGEVLGELIQHYGYGTDLRRLAMATQEAYLKLHRDDVNEMAKSDPFGVFK